jgi:hypothetical protein
MSAILLDAANNNLILGFVPESLGLLIFGVALILFAVVLRRIFNRNEEHQTVKKVEQTTQKINR